MRESTLIFEPTTMTPEQVQAFIAGAEGLADYLEGKVRFEGPIVEVGTPPEHRR